MGGSQGGRAKNLFIAGLLGGIFLAGLGLVLLRPEYRPQRISPPATGKIIPEFQLNGINGDILQSRDLIGKPLVINFWASWCQPCTREMPLLDREAARLQGEVIFIAVNDGESLVQVSAFQKENKLALPIYLDPAEKLNGLFYVQSYPTTFFFDKDGILRAQHIGELSESLLADILAEVEHPR